MKKLMIFCLSAILGIAFLGLAGAATSVGGIDISTLQKAFQSASSVDKAEVQRAISALKSHNYSAAMTSLGKVAQSTKLTPEQKNAVQHTLGQVSTNALGGVLGGTTNQAGQGAGKAAEELNKIFKP